jgi:hypothetical protein
MPSSAARTMDTRRWGGCCCGTRGRVLPLVVLLTVFVGVAACEWMEVFGALAEQGGHLLWV